MANLLDQASIVLTPTAYDNGKVLCAKPSEPPYGDFDFSRNSAATRVNAQGLVENVQILSSNLVQNGDFSEEGVQEVSNGSFSQEGAELVTNGDFSNGSTGWILDTGWSVSNEKLNAISVNSTSAITASFPFVGNSFKVTYTISDYSQGEVRLFLGGVKQTLDRSENGTFTEYITITSGNTTLYVQGVNDFTGSIDNVSVREVGQNWDLGTGWSIGEDKAVRVSTGTYTPITQGGILTAGKSYKVNYTINDGSVGGVRVQLGGTYSGDYNGVGTHTIYGVAGTSDFNNFKLVGEPSFTGSITNISVKEVGQNWTLQTGWSIADGKASAVASTQSAYQSGITLAVGNKYLCSFEITDYTSGQIVFACGSGGLGTNRSAIGVYTEVIVAGTGNIILLDGIGGTGAFTGSITNISVIEITDDTNLPRINYEGFSYQDALGSELITNGDFATDTGWNKGAGWSISGGTANCNGTTANIVSNIPITPSIGKQGKLKFEITNYVSGQIALSLNGTGGSDTGIFTPVNGFYEFDLFGVMTATSTFITIYSTAFIGSIDNVSVKEYLGQEVVPDSGCGSWLFEPQSTNLVTYSEDLSTYSTTAVTVSATTEKSPINSVTPFLITEIATTNQHYIGGNSISLSGNNTISCFVKNVSLGRYFKVWGFGLGGANEAVIFDTNTETIYEPPTSNVYVGGSAKLEDYGNGWFRCSITINTTTTNSLAIGLINTVTGFGNNTYTGDITKSVLITGIQVEQQSYATSYIPTSGSTVTRNQDLCTNGGSLASINSTEGVLYAEIAALANDGVTRRLAISDGTSANRVFVAYDQFTNSIQFVVSSGGAVVANKTVTISDITQFSKVAVKYKLNDCSFWIDGIKVGTDTTAPMPIGLNQVIFAQGDIARPFFGKTKALAVWKEALSDQELADLTYPTPTDPTFALDFDTIATDFTFARGSEATYVDAQGLIQSTNELGEELITNGDFSNGSTDWQTEGFSSIVVGDFKGKTDVAKININNASTGSRIRQPFNYVSGKTYKVDIEVYVQSGNFRADSSDSFVSGDFVSTSTLGSWQTLTANITAISTGSNYIWLRSISAVSEFYVSNVSVEEHITATNTPRLDYSTGAEAFLLEPQSTNLVTQSELFSDAVWVKRNSSVTSNDVLSPKGDLSADKLVEDNASSTDHSLRFNQTVISGSNYTLSCFIKKDSKDFVVLNIYDGVADFARATFNVDTGLVDTVTSGSAKIEDFGNGWFRCSVSGLATNSTGNQTIFLAEGSNDVIYNGDGTSGVYIWGAQLEQQSYVTSYIPTSGSTVTRNQETCINATPEINSEEGVLYFEGRALTNETTTLRSISLSNGTTQQRILIRYSSAENQLTLYSIENGNVRAVAGTNSYNLLEFNKIAISYKQNNFKFFVNGTKISEDNAGNTPTLLNKLSFNGGSGEPFYGNTKDIQVYTKALSDAELIKLTT